MLLRHCATHHHLYTPRALTPLCNTSSFVVVIEIASIFSLSPSFTELKYIGFAMLSCYVPEEIVMVMVMMCCCCGFQGKSASLLRSNRRLCCGCRYNKSRVRALRPPCVSSAHVSPFFSGAGVCVSGVGGVCVSGVGGVCQVSADVFVYSMLHAFCSLLVFPSCPFRAQFKKLRGKPLITSRMKPPSWRVRSFAPSSFLPSLLPFFPSTWSCFSFLFPSFGHFPFLFLLLM